VRTSRFDPEAAVGNELRIGYRWFGQDRNIECNSRNLYTTQFPLSVRANAILHGIQPGNWHACRLSSRVSRISRVRADASRPRGTVFRTGQYSNSGDGRRQHAEPDFGPKGHPTLLLRSLVFVLSLGNKLMNITNHLYLEAEAAMSMALAGASRPDGVKKLLIVFCAPLLLVVLLHG
jgi:hypothetical protein